MVQFGFLSQLDDVLQFDALILGVFQDESPDLSILQSDKTLENATLQLINEGDFVGKAHETAVLYASEQAKFKRLILVGIGSREEFSVEIVRNATAMAVKKAANLKLKNIAILLYEDETLSPSLMAEAIAESTLLTLYQYHGQKSSAFTPHTLEHVVLIGTDENNDLATIERSIAQATVVAESTALTRNLVNLPPNYCTPEYMATTAVEMANEVGLQVKVLDKEDLQALNMGAFLAVAQGSLTPPKFIILEHNAERAEDLPTVVLVGKGVTFDTGGYTIKSRDGMKGMKNDMSGGAAVIGALRAAALLEIPLHVVGLIPAADNMISGNAYRPDDVFTASNGKTVEIVSTDAEGRLLLADALVYASRYKPDVIVDIATLTGACVTALGGVMAGLFCTDTQLQQRLLEAGKLVNEPLWPLPLDEAYKKSLKSHTADTKNSGAPRGGASIAAMFLSNFVDCACWAHIDMAGIEMRNDSIAYIPSESASGYGTRLLIEFLRHWADL